MTNPKVDYRVRPAKHAERLMIAEALSRLRHLAPLESYRYFGMGALYFRDHVVFHKRLGIADLTNIEHLDGEGDRLRFEFNRPYAAVDLLFGTPSEATARFDSRPVIAWFDYEYRLDEEILDDIALFVRTVPDRSALIVTVNATSPGGSDDEAIRQIREDLGARAQDGLGMQQIRGKNLADLYKATIEREIERALATRAPNFAPQDQLRYEPLFHFRYRDGARMLTIGGLFVRGLHEQHMEIADFGSLDFVMRGDQAYSIDVPRLTHRETQYLDRLLPTNDEDNMATRARAEVGIPESEARKYMRLYRYLPSYADVDL